MKRQLLSAFIGAIFVSSSSLALSQQVDYQSAKGIVERTLAGEFTGQQAMDVAVLVFDPKGGNPIQRAAHQSFFSGERFKLKIRASQSGILQVANIEQSGKENRLSTAMVTAGVELIYPTDPNKFLEFDNNTGNETLRLSLVTAGMQGQTNVTQMTCPPACPLNYNPAPNPPAPPQPTNSYGYQQTGGGYAQQPSGLPNPYPSQSQQPQYQPQPQQQQQQYQPQPQQYVQAQYQPQQQPQQQVQTGSNVLYGNAVGKAFVTGKGIKEVVLEIPPGPGYSGGTQIVQPLNGGGLSYEMQIKHY